MKVLVTAASKHGSTEEIAREISGTLEENGLQVVVTSPEEVRSVDEYDAVVLGSAVYAGHWMKEAKELVDRLSDALAERPVWLLSSGPIGDPPKPEEDPVDVAEVMDRTGARNHRVFAGKLFKKGLSFGEKAIVLALRAPEGDFRDWDEIRSWAVEIAEAIQKQESKEAR
ncbi:MAG: flavodoxin domain-containing protein [Actinomycetota bacterium]